MPTDARRTTRRPSRSSRLRCERSIRIDSWVVEVLSPSRLVPPSVPLGMSVLVSPTHGPRRAATASVVCEPNCVVAETCAITLPPGFERSARVRASCRWTIANVGCGLGAGFALRGTGGAETRAAFNGGAPGTAASARGAGAAASVVTARCDRARYAAETAISPSMATSSTTTICAREGRGMVPPVPSSSQGRCKSRPGHMFYWSAPALKQHVARLQVRAALALHALKGVVHGLRVAGEPLRDRLVRVPVEVERQHRALEL